MSTPSITLENIIGKTIMVGISYFDQAGEILNQKKLAGTVVRTTKEDGITLRDLNEESEFTLPSELSPWFVAPAGEYHDPISGQKVKNPDYLVTWDVHQTQENTPEGEHEWWEWRPQLANPSVGQ